jgi:phospholipid N-methyltransferase
VPRTIDALRNDNEFSGQAVDSVIAAVPFRNRAEAAE